MTVALTPLGLAKLQQRIADAAVIADIETACVRTGPAAHRLWDTRPMLDPREHCPESIDMAELALLYAELRGLITIDTLHPHLVRINPQPSKATP